MGECCQHDQPLRATERASTKSILSLIGKKAILTHLTCRSTLGERLGRWQHFADRQIVAVAGRCSVVDRNRCTAQRSWGILHLHPVSVARGGQILVNDGLGCPWSARGRIVVVVSDSEDPRIISCGDESRRRRALRRTTTSRKTNGSRTVRA